MASYFNILAGLLSFIGGSALQYAMWNPVWNFLAEFPTELYVLIGGAWVIIAITSIVIFPIIMFISDDKGE